MSVALGTNIINELYVGNTPIKKIFYAVTSSDIRTIYESQINAVKFEPLQNGSSIKVASLASGATLEYSFNGATWYDATVGTIILLRTQQGLRNAYIRGNARSSSSFDYTNLTISGKVKVSGNINALWGYTNLNQNLTMYSGYALFKDSTGLYDARELLLPATTVPNYCYSVMFQGCTSLTTAPTALPATTLGIGCYEGMFKGCTSLTIVPQLTTALENGCYYEMFKGCTSLTTAPDLNSTGNLPDEAFAYMFQGCTNLNYVKCLATSVNNSNSTNDWLDGVAATGTFVKNSNASFWTRTSSGIPSGWTVINA